jgi:transcription-repair coupling factor (superfamily II helicase)
MAARDLSVITTPPNRYPIETNVVVLAKTIRDAISYEIQRNDSFFINNRIENIKEVAGMIQRLSPTRVGIGHGQMGKKLEELMLAFYER